MQGLVKTCLEMCAVALTEVYSPAIFNEHSMQLCLRTGLAAERETGWNLDTKSRRDKCSSDLRTAKPKNLIANRPCPLFLNANDNNIGKSSQLESTEDTVLTTRSHLPFAVRECFEQVHRDDHFSFENRSKASSLNKVCVQKLIGQPSVSQSQDAFVIFICHARIRIYEKTDMVVDESHTLGTSTL